MEAPKNAEQLIKGIDFPLLKEQKKALLKLIEDIDDVPQLEKLEGVITLINEIQDLAVDVLGYDENLVFDLHPDDEDDSTDEECTDGLKVSPLYFEIVQHGINKEILREELQIHAGENGNVFLFKTKEGFKIHVLGQQSEIDSIDVFENMLVVDFEETDAPENFSDIEIKEFKEKWGQMHNEVCRELGYPLPHVASDELLMVDFFWIEKDRKWYNKCASSFTPREQAIADFLKLE